MKLVFALIAGVLMFAQVPECEPPAPSPPGSIASVRSGEWTDAGTWGGRLPEPRDEITVSAGHVVSFPAGRSTTVTAERNMIVHGTLRMRPDSADVTHVLRFENVDVNQFVGGGMNPLRTDVGLWVMNQGRLDLKGTPRTGWLRAGTNIPQGARSITLEGEPSGWRAGDDIVVTPTEPPGSSSFSTAFDESKITAVAGNVVTTTGATARAHPVVDGRWTAEVANLTRNVRIEGTPGKQSHVFIRSGAAQQISYVELRYMGVRDVAGRYPIHFHHSLDGSRLSEVVGTVVRDAGHHAFVAHMSNGVTFRDTVAYNVVADGYWWDPPPHSECRRPDDPRHGRNTCEPSKSADVRIEHGLAARIPGNACCLSNIPNSSRLAGFELSDGPGNSVVDSVAVGVATDNAGQASGFEWPEGSGVADEAVWEFARNVSHNNADNGIFVWQNVRPVHPIVDFAGYHNGKFGIDHGAYSNNYAYSDSVLFGNGRAPEQQRAVARGGQLSFVDMEYNAKGGSLGAGVLFREHRIDSSTPTLYLRPRIIDAPVAFLFGSGGANQPIRVDVVCPTYVRTPNVVKFDGTNSASKLRVQNCDGSAKEYTPANPNGRSIPKFA